MAAENAHFDLSTLEAQVLVAIDHVGWYAYLWFPTVHRETLNFGSDAPDEAVHAAFASLIKKCALEVAQNAWGEVPQWNPAPGALAAARAALGS